MMKAVAEIGFQPPVIQLRRQERGAAAVASGGSQALAWGNRRDASGDLAPGPKPAVVARSLLIVESFLLHIKYFS